MNGNNKKLTTVKLILGVVIFCILAENSASFPTEDGTDFQKEETAPGNRTRRRADYGSIDNLQYAYGCQDYGCHKGRCWAWCGVRPDDHKQWCWTTRGNMWDLQYVGCSSHNDCDGCWHCAGTCSL
ncbi:Allergen Tha p 2 [Folsomia candida]|uniref:Allergen Tha p 2 n=1 Tax=Folsomia candida TaxID=158441 RepID=A0A226F569_FOLCA|nr:Allergen Tha p 2 [Folsomia candida]